MGSSRDNLVEDQNIDAAAEIQDDAATEEPLEVQDSPVETYTDVTLDDINRDDLDPQMQSAYDTLSGRHAEMQAGFTQSTQRAAQSIKDAESWQNIIGNPQLARVLTDAVYKIEHGIPLDQQDAAVQEPPEIPDSETDPDGYIRHLIKSELKDALGEVMPGLQNQMSEVTGFVRGNQAELEFDALAIKYPAVKTVGLQAVQRTQQGYSDPSGRPISMEKAVAIMALDNPSIIQTNVATAKQNSVGKKPARVEQSRTSRGAGSTVDVSTPTGFKALQTRVANLMKDGKLGLEHAGRRATGIMSKLSQDE